MDEITIVVKQSPTKSTHQSALRVMKRRGGGFFVGKYASSAIKAWTAEFAENVRKHKPDEPWDCPVHVSIHFFFPWPESAPKKNKDKLMWKTTKPDLDNSEKTILDTLTKEGFIRDDSIICSKTSEKYFSPEPKILIVLRKIP